MENFIFNWTHQQLGSMYFFFSFLPLHSCITFVMAIVVGDDLLRRINHLTV